MLPETTESMPVMQDVRIAQREARRVMAISQWPLMLLGTVR